MARYFQIANGLRGCYLNDSSSIIPCDTRRDLKHALEWWMNNIRDAEFVGVTKKDIAWAAAKLWRKDGDAVLPYGRKGSKDRPFAIFVYQSDRAEFLAQED